MAAWGEPEGRPRSHPAALRRRAGARADVRRRERGGRAGGSFGIRVANRADLSPRAGRLGRRLDQGAPPTRLPCRAEHDVRRRRLDARGEAHSPEGLVSGRGLPLPRRRPGLDRARIDSGLADGSLVVDMRLRDALAARVSSFPVPSIVDDSSYAVECAAVGEVDLVRLDRQIRDLELRIAELEARFWPTRPAHC